MLYHRSCYNSYTRNATTQERADNNANDIYEIAFAQLVSVVQEKIVDGLDVMKVTELRDNYFDILADSGLDAPNYRAEKVKSRLQNHFGDKLAFWQPT